MVAPHSIAQSLFLNRTLFPHMVRAGDVSSLLDPAHVFFSHDGMAGGGDRDAAGPLWFEVSSSVAQQLRSSEAR